MAQVGVGDVVDFQPLDAAADLAAMPGQRERTLPSGAPESRADIVAVELREAGHYSLIRAWNITPQTQGSESATAIRTQPHRRNFKSLFFIPYLAFQVLLCRALFIRL